MRVTAIQMNMKFGDVEYNFSHSQDLIRKAVASEKPDVVVLPEAWNTGFFPKENLKDLCDKDGVRTKETMGALAKELNVNIVAGSISNIKDDKPFNTSFVFDRSGECLAEYDKVHLFTYMGEHNHYSWGENLSTFVLDGVKCGIIICYDIRFPELIRSLTLRGIEVLFVPAQWPDVRVNHLNVLSEARAIENQMYLALCNSCGKAGETQYGGNSAMIDPWGKVLVRAGGEEEVISADFDLSIIKEIRDSINVFRDRRTEVYDLEPKK